MNGKTIVSPIASWMASGRYPLRLPRNMGHAGMLRVLACFTNEIKYATPMF